MTATPVYAVPGATVESIARLMSETNCGEIPICKDGRLVGVVTDRDVVCRTIARGLDPSSTKASDVMTLLPVTVFDSDALREAIRVMEEESIRRVPVVDSSGALVGILSQVDVAMRASQRKAGHMLAKARPLPLAKI
ncbi:MAG TPA: CBS domain-containing protein [Thermoanaerobaculia bacterium]|nr:CBS domain-containing protein [Thermoanaerobaculia bacterium]